MIASDNGYVKIDGEVEDVLADLTLIIKHIRKLIAEQTGDDIAEELINRSFELSAISDEEVEIRAFEAQRIKQLERIARGEQNGKGEKQSGNHRQDN